MTAVGLTLLSAALYCAAFPPLGLFPLAWVALAPLLVAAASAGPMRALGLGLLWSVAANLGVAGFLPGAIAAFFDVSAPTAWASFAAVAVGLTGVYVVPFTVWVAWLSRRAAGPSPWLIGLGFAVCEAARLAGPVPSPWALTAVSQVPWPALAQTADLAGPFGIAFLVASANAAIAGWWTRGLRPRAAAWQTAAVAAGLAAALAYGHVRLEQDFGAGAPVDVAAVQGALDLDQRFDENRRDANLARYLDLTDDALTRSPALVLWPESSVDFYLREPGPESTRLARWSADVDADLLVGGPEFDAPPLFSASPRPTRYFNSIFLVRSGQLAQRYDKVHLTPFSESRPLEPISSLGNGQLSPGPGDVRLLDTRAGAVGVLLCSESMLPDHVRRVSLAGAQVLANHASDDWFGDAAAARQQLAAASLRAIENRRYVVRAATSGYSAVIDPHGRVLAASRFGEPGVVAGSVRPLDATTPYQRWGHAAPLPAAALAGAWSLLPLAPRRPKEGTSPS